MKDENSTRLKDLLKEYEGLTVDFFNKHDVDGTEASSLGLSALLLSMQNMTLSDENFSVYIEAVEQAQKRYRTQQKQQEN